MSLPPKHVYVYFCVFIKRPHDKIALCACDEHSWCFWFNSDASFHGVAQLPITTGEHAAISRDCFLDLSAVKYVTEQELKSAKDRGPISDALKARILEVLKKPIPTLPDAKRTIILGKLS